MQPVNFSKYSVMLEGIRDTVEQIIGPLQENSEMVETCGSDCDCEDCKEKHKDDNMGEGKEFWIQKAIKRPGALHKKTKTPAGKNISAKKLSKAAHSKNPTTRKQAALAKTLKSFHKK